MPNHIQNRLHVSGDPIKVKGLFDAIASKNEEGESMQIDFDKIVPMPEGLRVQTHSQVIEWAEICTCLIDFSSLFTASNIDRGAMFKAGKYGDLAKQMQAQTAMESITGKRRSVKDFSNEELEQFIQCVKNVREHGFTTWYEWSVENWGTKWNAYEQNDKRNTEDTIYFQTAWSSPLQLIGKLSEKFPLLTFQIDYADEDSGSSNTDKVTIQNGELLARVAPKSQSLEAYDIYFELNPDRKEDYKLIGESYEYIEQE